MAYEQLAPFPNPSRETKGAAKKAAAGAPTELDFGGGQQLKFLYGPPPQPPHAFLGNSIGLAIDRRPFRFRFQFVFVYRGDPHLLSAAAAAAAAP